RPVGAGAALGHRGAWIPAVPGRLRLPGGGAGGRQSFAAFGRRQPAWRAFEPAAGAVAARLRDAAARDAAVRRPREKFASRLARARSRCAGARRVGDRRLVRADAIPGDPAGGRAAAGRADRHRLRHVAAARPAPLALDPDPGLARRADGAACDPDVELATDAGDGHGSAWLPA